MDRENLEIRTRAFTTKILFEGQKAVGVEYEWQGGVHRVYAEKIVLSAGAINTRSCWKSPALVTVRF